MKDKIIYEQTAVNQPIYKGLWCSLMVFKIGGGGGYLID